jgi:hypothetical protein
MTRPEFVNTDAATNTHSYPANGQRLNKES